ncbi:hypothetical protein H6P81_002716 [Aristolochia fimbriata]|uniref:Ubiquitin-like protease family profile domain-containing protein n=1 Tax=Aristolochia fimbriata TaxID=158543 RepID=A0AAV7FF37_ARIFI|nr:hypothetical protein H6P81_002716 [Aristolochia fimbriata]
MVSRGFHNATNYELVTVEDHPQQKTGYDCGIFLVKYMDLLSRDGHDDEQSEMDVNDHVDFTSSAIDMIPGMGFNVIQELRSNQSISRRTYAKEVESKYVAGSGFFLSKATGNNLEEGPSRRRQGKASSNDKHSSHKHGLFPNSGFKIFFLKPMSSRLSASPHGQGIRSRSSLPVGSMPKPFPPFAHPSHQLLEENGKSLWP